MKVSSRVLRRPALEILEDRIVPVFPMLSWSASTYSQSEGGGTVTLTAVLSVAQPGTVTVDYATANVTATAGSDYTAASGTLTFPSGSTSQSFNVSLTDDTLDENDETFTATLSNATGGMLGTPSVATVTITDDDEPPTVYWYTTSGGASENSGGIMLTAGLSAASGKTVTVAYASADGTAMAGSDYTGVSGTLTFTPGTTTQTVTVPITQDSTDEDEETFSVGLSGPSNATLGSPSSVTVSITDDDDPPTVSWAASSYTAAEGDGTATLTATLSAASGKTVTVNYATSNGTATADSDYTSTSGTLTFSPGQTSKTVSVPVHTDSLVEGDETFTAALSGASNATLATPTMATVTIGDDTLLGAQPDEFALLHDTTLTVPVPGVLGNDGWLPGGSPSVAVDDSPDHGTLSLASDGSFEYTPAAGYVGGDSFTYTLTSAGQSPSTATVSLTVHNQAPGGHITPYSLHAGTTLTVAEPGLRGFIQDLDIEDADRLTFTLLDSPEHADSFAFHPDTTFAYTPEPGFVGTDQFSFTVSDGALTSDPIVVELVVENTRPLAQDNTFFVAVNGTLIVSDDPVLGNDFDEDGDPLTMQVVSGPDPLATASFTWNADGSFTFEPVANYSGAVTFAYTASDGTESSEEATVTITVTSDPVPQEDYYLVPGDDPLVVSVTGGLLSNDFNPDPSQPVTVRVVSAPPSADVGDLQVNADGSFTFTPAAAFVSFNFTYGLEAQGNFPGFPLTTVHLLKLATGSGVRLQSVTFLHEPGHGELYIQQDPTVARPREYKVNQWYDSDANGLIDKPADRKDPTVYARTYMDGNQEKRTKMAVQATFLIDPVLTPFLEAANRQPDPDLRLAVGSTWSLGGVQMGEGIFAKNPTKNREDPVSVDEQRNILVVWKVFEDPLPFDQVAYLDKFGQHFSLMLGTNLQAIYPIGQSENPVYQTWKKPPEGFKLYHTLVDVGTKGAETLWANGPPQGVIADQIPGAIFDAKFKLGPNNAGVKRVDGTPIKYYGQWTTKNSTTAKLLEGADGQCTSWASFFLDTLRVQGLTYTTPYAVIRSANSSVDPLYDEWFLVNDWTFIPPDPKKKWKPNKDSPLVYEWENKLANGDKLIPARPMTSSIAANRYLFPNNPGTHSPDVDGNRDPLLQQRTGLAGQNNPRPFSMFNNHIIIEIGNVFYDPSYGASYAGTEPERLNALEQAAINGFAYQPPDTDVVKFRFSTGTGGLKVSEKKQRL